MLKCEKSLDIYLTDMKITLSYASYYLVLVGGPDWEQDLPDPDPGNGSVGLTEGSSHPSLEPTQRTLVHP